jgi:hypothetical protein
MTTRKTLEQMAQEATMERMAEDDDIQVYQRPWVGLTHQEISNEVISDEPDFVQGFVQGARWAEAILEDKNT